MTVRLHTPGNRPDQCGHDLSRCQETATYLWTWLAEDDDPAVEMLYCPLHLAQRRALLADCAATGYRYPPPEEPRDLENWIAWWRPYTIRSWSLEEEQGNERHADL